MKTLFTLLAAVSLSVTSFAQQTANLIVFSDDGQPFYLVINGVRQNMKAETNVRVTDLKAEAQRVKIIFENTTIPAVDGNAYCEFGMETTYRIKKDKKGAYKLAGFGMPVAIASATGAGSSSVAYHAEPWPETTGTTTSTGTTGSTGTVSSTGTQSTGTQSTVGVTSTTTTTTTSTTTSGNTGTVGVGTSVNVNETTTGTGENVSMNVNMGGVDFNMNVNVSGTGTETGTGTTGTSTVEYTETVTTTSTSTTGGSTGTGSYTSTSATASGACYYPITDADYRVVKSSVDSKDFEDTKVSTAKQAIKSKGCFSTAQIKGLLSSFDFEDSKLDVAKFAYDYCSDKDNYFSVGDVFDFDASVEELNAYISKR
jgi:hypothetical protein